ncbi:MAG: hypothetical protein ABI112_09675 [Terracoccus sp.]
MTGPERRQRAGTAASTTDGVISRDSLARLGLSYVDVRTEIRAGRWRCHGLQTVAVHNGTLGVEANRWRAIWETGIGVAVIDGVTALQVAGLRHYDDEVIHVSVVHTASVKKLTGTYLHKVIRRLPDELAPSGIPRTRPAVAALRAAFWARTDRQAALILLMVVQQRLTTPLQLLEVSGQLRGRKRRRLVRTVIADAIDGVQSLGELDFARMCRARGLPEPVRQEVRRGPRGRVYLDVRWSESRLVVEIDGSQHREGLGVSADNLSRNEVTLQNDRVLRIDLIGLRLHENEFMDQVERGIRTHSR